jgi:hypothetical protein
MPTREEIHAAFEKGEAAVVELFLSVGRQMEELNHIHSAILILTILHQPIAVKR